MDFVFKAAEIYWTFVFVYIFGYTLYRLYKAIRQMIKTYRSKKCQSEHLQSEFNAKLYFKYIWKIIFPFLEGHKIEKKK